MKFKKPLFVLLFLGIALCLPGLPSAMASAVQPGDLRDTVSQPPQIDIHIDALTGMQGWYRSVTTISVIDHNAPAGEVELEMQTDGGGWQPLQSFQLTEDGFHLVEIRSTDVDGNQATLSKEVRIDQHDPIGQFLAPQGGTPVQGLVQVSGSVHDELSGMGQVSISTDDGKTWQAIPLHPDGSWSITWDTRSEPDGMHPMQAKFTDQAGNTSSAEIFYIVANHPVQIRLAPRWDVSDIGKLDIVPGDLALMDVTIDISDSYRRWPDAHQDFSPNHIPKEIAWDGKFGQVQAPAGEYNVTVKVTDQMAQEIEAHGVIVIPPIATPTATPPGTWTGPPRLLPYILACIGLLIAITWIAANKSGIGTLSKLRKIIVDLQNERQK